MHAFSRISASVSLVVLLLLISGCGYSIHSRASLPFHEITIGTIENATVEPKVEDKMHRALAAECLKQGISVTRSAPVKLTGIIRKFSLDSLSQKGDTTVEYQVNVEADFKITRENGTVEALNKIDSPFIVPLTGTADLAGLLAAKDAVVERAMRDIAVEVIGSLIYK